MRFEAWPSLPFKHWRETKDALHLRTQIVGKIRLALTPPVNHWWHAALYVSARGLQTGPIPMPAGSFEMEFDFLTHDLVVRTSEGTVARLPLPEQNVATFFRELTTTLTRLGIDVNGRFAARPFDFKDAVPFAEDTAHSAYDAQFVERFHRILAQVDLLFKAFRGRFLGKVSPVHFFWHSFDLAVTRFSGRRAAPREEADSVTQQAYSHEVISAGFWPGDDRIGEPAFYSYVYPEPSELTRQPLRPEEASWHTQPTGSMALLMYEQVRSMPDPEHALLEFLQSTYEAGANLAKWPRGELESTFDHGRPTQPEQVAAVDRRR